MTTEYEDESDPYLRPYQPDVEGELEPGDDDLEDDEDDLEETKRKMQ